MDKNKMKELCIKKIKNNIFDGILYASPSNTPDYRYYWIRDAALVYRCIIEEHLRTKLYLPELLNYIETERRAQKTKTLTGIGEPKFNPDISAFNESWGRPQNDGPALRGLNMIKLYHFFYEQKYFSLCNNVIKPIIETDIKYIIGCYNKPSFDLWEEKYGWHFYTRVVQFKCVKEYSLFMNYFGIDYDKDGTEKLLYDMLLKINHHKTETGIISSFNEDGSVEKKNDSSVIMALTHTDFDETILETIDISLFKNSAETIAKDFRNKYKKETVGMVGRYIDDGYYGGHIWIICSLSFSQFFLYLYSIGKRFIYKKKAADIINKILDIDKNYDIAEQYNMDNNKQVSAEKLSWNYSELYYYYKLLE
jgi:glucoamylase